MGTGWVVALAAMGILTGTPAANEFPVCVVVGDMEQHWFSSGTLVAPNVVVTLARVASRAQHVGLGERVGNGLREIRVKQVVLHPGFNPTTFANDLALLILEQDVPEFRPSSPALGPLIDGARTIRVVGFGLTEGGSFGAKRYADIPVVTPNSRDPRDQERYGSIAGRELVARDPDGKKDAAAGDSGGPAFVRDDQGTWRLAAVTSRATKDSVRPSGDGGIYLRLDGYWDWIQEAAVSNGGHWRKQP